MSFIYLLIIPSKGNKKYDLEKLIPVVLLECDSISGEINCCLDEELFILVSHYEVN